MSADRSDTETVHWQGRELLLRPIGPEDDARHTAFFAHEAPNDLHLRFFGSRRKVPHDEITRLVHPDTATEVAFVVLAERAGGSPKQAPEELATARAVSGANNIEAELGITVRSDLKGQGLGHLLLAKIIDSVRRRGTQRIVCDVLQENQAMRALATRFSFQIEKRTLAQESLHYVLELQPGKRLPTG
jgi:acetyltransferase